MAYNHSFDLPRSAAAWSSGQPVVNDRDGEREGMKGESWRPNDDPNLTQKSGSLVLVRFSSANPMLLRSSNHPELPDGWRVDQKLLFPVLLNRRRQYGSAWGAS